MRDLENFFDLATADSVHFGVEVDCCITVVDPDFELLSGLDRETSASIDFDRGMLGVKRSQFQTDSVFHCG